MPHFSYLILKMGKVGISKNEHVINFKTEREPKMKFFDFGAFQKIMQILSHHVIHMTKSSFTWFLGYFILLSVYEPPTVQMNHGSTDRYP